MCSLLWVSLFPLTQTSSLGELLGLNCLLYVCVCVCLRCDRQASHAGPHVLSFLG